MTPDDNSCSCKLDSLTKTKDCHKKPISFGPSEIVSGYNFFNVILEIIIAN